MLRVFSCIGQEHDYRLVLVAGLICLLGTFTTFGTLEQTRRDGKSRPFWFCLAAIVSATGIWSTHFVAMLAYQPRIPVRYDLQITLLSALAAIFVGGLGWFISMRNRRGAAYAGGMVVAASIGTMHYIGMAAVHVPGQIVWDYQLVGASVALGGLLSVAAIVDYRRNPRFIAWRPAILLTLAICGLHFTAMAAAVIHPDGSSIGSQASNSRTLALIVAAPTLLILLVSIAVVLVQRKLVRLAAQERIRVKALEEAVSEGEERRAALTCELKQQADISSAALSSMAQGLSMFDGQDRLITFNRHYAEIYALPAELLELGTPLVDILNHCVANGSLPEKLEYYLGESRDSGWNSSHSEMALGDGAIIEIQRRPLPGGGWVATHEDITDRRRAAQRSDYLASHDELTGLPNRTAFAEQLQAAISRLDQGQAFALHSVDLDRFKEVNDTLGHPVGDELLKQVSARLRETVGNHELISRLAGDEFAILQPNLANREDAAALAKRMINALSEPFQFDDHTIAIGASIGIALAPQDSRLAGDLLKKSDLALYRAKADSRGNHFFFELGMDARLRERRELETDLRIAIQKGQFELHYQPLLNVAAHTITGFEALIRWRHPTRGLLPPVEFIAAAEETGLIIPIGEWVLRQACRDASKWPEPIRVAVNLSAAQFKRGDLHTMTATALAAAGLAPERLELEITESVLLHDETWVRTVLQQLRNLGVHIAMDDFGTGYSSLSYLRSFPFSKIKIDQSFVSDLSDTSDALAIVQATIQLSKKLGMCTTAEGVETIEQLDILAAEGCTEVQGFHISRAIPAFEIRAFLNGYRNDEARSAAA